MAAVGRLLQNIFWIIEKAPFMPNKEYVCLGITCSLEHLTASLAEILLTTKEGRYVLESMSPSHRTLWVWHAIEETEHKAVAFDVYVAAGGWYISRVFRHFTTTVVFILVMIYLNVVFFVDRGNMYDVVGIFRLFYFLFGYPGFFRKFVPLWCQYLVPGFHPWGHGEVGQKHKAKMTSVIAQWTDEMHLLQSQHQRAAHTVEYGDGNSASKIEIYSTKLESKCD
mmetsp:Transcript_26787/g.50115  ORF Transcript_26787/g.50115 Transcript_26787/m.50115 type:complete len:224 (+) Transcript_26787:274-945(+)